MGKEFRFVFAHIVYCTVTVRHEYSKSFVGLVCGSMRVVFDLYRTG